MRISFEVSGGLGGLFSTAPLSYLTSTEDLPDQEADLLRRLIEESGLLAPGHPLPARSRTARDVFRYQVQITSGGQTYRHDFDDTTVPVQARPLLDHLTAAAMRRRTGGPPTHDPRRRTEGA